MMQKPPGAAYHRTVGFPRKIRVGGVEETYDTSSCDAPVLVQRHLLGAIHADGISSVVGFAVEIRMRVVTYDFVIACDVGLPHRRRSRDSAVFVRRGDQPAIVGGQQFANM